MAKYGSLSALVALLVVACSPAYSSGSPTATEVVPVPRSQSSTTTGGSTDCSAAYGGDPATCRRVTCSKQYLRFIGVWKGKFHAYVRKLSTAQNPVYRPYLESVSYEKSDCLKNIKTGETFIVGHETSHYPKFRDLPSFTQKVLLIMGKDKNGEPFLRRVSDKGMYKYTLAYKDDPASLSIWKLSMASSKGQPAMTFTTIDAKEQTETPTQTRNVTITLAIGPTGAPYWQGVIAFGSHTRQKNSSGG